MLAHVFPADVRAFLNVVGTFRPYEWARRVFKAADLNGGKCGQKLNVRNTQKYIRQTNTSSASLARPSSGADARDWVDSGWWW